MQRAVHNRATIRVANRTDVSGRATADEVNLDRFHNRIRKVCALVAATLISSSSRWKLLFTVLIVPQVLWGVASASATPSQKWHATVGAQSDDKARQALAFLPNEIWIHAGDSIEWRFDVDEVHTVTFIPDSEVRPFFGNIPAPLPSNPATFDGSAIVSSPGALDSAFVKGKKFTVNFPTTGNFKQVCLFHQNMTGVVHVLEANARLPHDQDFYDRQAADQRRDLLSDRDGVVAACHQHGECAAHDSLKARVVTRLVGHPCPTSVRNSRIFGPAPRHPPPGCRLLTQILNPVPRLPQTPPQQLRVEYKLDRSRYRQRPTSYRRPGSCVLPAALILVLYRVRPRVLQIMYSRSQPALGGDQRLTERSDLPLNFGRI